MRATGPHRSTEAVLFQRLIFSAFLCLCAVALTVPVGRAQEVLFDGSVFRVEWDAPGVADLSTDDQARLLQVYVDPSGGNPAGRLPPVAGSYRLEDGALVFEPRFPPAPGVSYRTIFDPSAVGLPGFASVLTFDVPRRQAPPTFVEHVYPSTDVLPENQLKLYIHFSASMARGEAYRHIRLLDEDGMEVELAFLELDQELWTRDFRRFTILFDPGRIKTGLVPNLVAGRALVPGRTYTLVIGRDWRDANGQRLLREYRKTFRAGPFDDVAPDVSTWRLTVPRAGTTDPAAIEFPEPMDRGLVDRLIAVADPTGATLEGTVGVDRDETRWLFVPVRPWQPGDYEIVVGAELEDLAGNALNGLFEVDVFEVDQPGTPDDTEVLPFTISAQ